MKAILLISHGSRSPKTLDEIKNTVSVLKKRSGLSIFHYAFLEIESPSIAEGIDLCVKDGATQIVVLLNFLNAGKHVDTDIPRIVAESQREYPNVKISITKPVGQHPGIHDLFLQLI